MAKDPEMIFCLFKFHSFYYQLSLYRKSCEIDGIVVVVFNMINEGIEHISVIEFMHRSLSMTSIDNSKNREDDISTIKKCCTNSD